MSLFNKVIWSEGMFLRPQHFQQQDRYVEHLLRRNSIALRPHVWGMSELAIDHDLLKTGKFGILQCSGVFRDGTSFNIPDGADPPTALDLNETVKDSTVYLALPVEDPRGLETDLQGTANGSLRYGVSEVEIRDSAHATDTPERIQVGRLRFRLMLESEERGGFQCLALARIIQVGADGTVLLDENFMPPCLDYRVPAKLGGFLRELQGLLHQRGESLAGRASEAGRGGTSEIADFLLLQTVNRYEPVVAHLVESPNLHPETMYRLLLEMAGELATFSSGSKRPPPFGTYRHDELQETFDPVIASLRQSLSMVFERSAISIPLEERKFGIRVATISDTSLLTGAMFVLAVSADVSAEALRRSFPAQIKIGPVEKIRDLVNRALPGIGIEALPVAPRQIPFHANVTYFALDTKSALWKELQGSGGLAMHIGGKFPGLELAFWAIRR